MDAEGDVDITEAIRAKLSSTKAKLLRVMKAAPSPELEHAHPVLDENTWTRVGWSPFRGRELVGWTQVTVVAGVPVFERTPETGHKGRVLVQPGAVG